MGKVRVNVMVSLDGYMAGPNIRPEAPFGDGVDGFLDWVFRLRSFREQQGMEGGETGPSDAVMREAGEGVGATVMGRSMFGGGPGPWTEPRWDGWWGPNPPYHHPVYVLTHHARAPLEMEGGTIFHFVTGGIDEALKRARADAGALDVRIGGGAQAVNQYLAAGLVDQLDLHIVPKLIGGGARLFEGLGSELPKLELVRTVAGPEVTHVRYRVVNSG